MHAPSEWYFVVFQVNSSAEKVVLGELPHSHVVVLDCQWIRDHATHAVGDPLIVQDCGPVLLRQSLHRGLILRLLRVLLIHVVCDVEWLAAKEVLLELLGVDNLMEVPLHFCPSSK